MEVRASFDLPPEVLEEVAQRAAELVSAQPEPWLDADGAAAHLACKRQRIYDLVSRRAIPFRKEGSRLLFRASELDRWLGV